MSKFVEIDVLRCEKESGVIAVITKRTEQNGFEIVSYAFFREYEPRPGAETRRTSYLNARHLNSVALLLPRIDERIQMDKEKTWEQNRVS